MPCIACCMPADDNNQPATECVAFETTLRSGAIKVKPVANKVVGKLSAWRDWISGIGCMHANIYVPFKICKQQQQQCNNVGMCLSTARKERKRKRT